MTTQTTTEEQTWCTWCRQAMTPDQHGDWITCPNAGDAYIDCCPCCDTWPEEPAPDPLLHAARELGFEPETCVMVGDTTVDMRAARAAGTQAIGVLCGFGEEAELRRSGADFILPSTADLTAVL